MIGYLEGLPSLIPLISILSPCILWSACWLRKVSFNDKEALTTPLCIKIRVVCKTEVFLTFVTVIYKFSCISANCLLQGYRNCGSTREAEMLLQDIVVSILLIWSLSASGLAMFGLTVIVCTAKSFALL